MSREFETEWEWKRLEKAKIEKPYACAVGSDGLVYVTNLWSNALTICAPDGAHIDTWEAPRELGNRIYTVATAKVDRERQHALNDALQSTSQLASWPCGLSQICVAYAVCDVVYVLVGDTHTSDRAVCRLHSSGAPHPLAGELHLVRPRRFETVNFSISTIAASDNDGKVYMAGVRAEHMVYAFASDGAQTGAWGLWPHNFYYIQPRGLAISRDGKRMYLAASHATPPALQCFHTDIGDGGDGVLLWSQAVGEPCGIVTAADGRVFVTDQFAFCVRVFSSDGTLLQCIGERGSSSSADIKNGPRAKECPFRMPCGLALSPCGSLLYVADTLANGLWVIRV